MKRRTAGLIVAASVVVALFVSAFVAAPRSCQGGLEFYFWSGVFALVILFAIPFVLRTSERVLLSIAWSLGLMLLGTVCWLGGLFAANVQLLCRLI